MVPVAEQGASSRTASNGPACHCADVGGDGFRGQMQAGQILSQPFEAGRCAVDGDDPGAGSGELGGLAARGGAKIGDGEAAYVAEELRRQRRGGVLDPPGAIGIARKLRDRSMHLCPYRAGRQDASAERARPLLGVARFTVRSSAGSRPLATAIMRAVSTP